MRVGTNFLYQGIQQRLSKLMSDVAEMNQKIASSKKINRPSDDPLGAMTSLGLKDVLARFDQYVRNLDTASSWGNQSEAALSQTIDLIGSAKEIATQMASDTQDANTRAMAAGQVGQLLDQAISLANTRSGATFLFAGYRTSTTPFARATVAGIETAQYLGDTNDFQVQIGEGENIAAGRNGQTVFVDSGLFDTLGRLKLALENNDQANIAAQLDNLNDAQTHIDTQIADVGARQNRLDMRQEAVGSLEQQFRERLSNTEDLDIAQAVIEMQQKQLAYQAALAAASQINQLSLLDYMK